MAPLYKKCLVLGASSGIGEALAAKLIATGTKVIIVGRRRDKLDAFVKEHGEDNARAVVFDVTNLNAIKDFADSITQSDPDLDAVVFSSGIQRGFDFCNPETVDLEVLGDELTTNYTSAVHLTAAFLPHLKKQSQGHLVYVSATLGLIPSMVRTPNYNASKSALHTFILNVREQLKAGGVSHVRMIEVFPPAVQTELHDEKHQPDLINGGEIGMPLDEYTEKMFDGLVRGDDQFAVGPGESLFKEDGFETQRMKLYEVGREFINKSLAKYLKK
ncbi:oxidoreductase dltE [Fusarium beomiforme]|uniref:Oxidoreductase dltE n=1 Tax=Fusarium beomiforme TaxID=44412 RepID=A0A9P5E035_9HYPO|nr:oxidoreductase dltE [Fusarium beomiforme]